jgi:hypothetical protein
MMPRTTLVILLCAVIGTPLAAAQERSRKAADPAAAANGGAAAAEQAAVAAQLNRRLPEINFGGQGLADVIDFYRDVSGANIFVDWKMLEAAGIGKDAAVSLRLRDVPFRAALAKLCETISTDKGAAVLTVEDGAIIITTAEDPKHPRAKVTVTGLPERLDRRLPEIGFSGQGLADVVDFLRDVAGANIFVDWRAMQKAGIGKDVPVSVRLRDVRFSTALKRILEDVSDRKTPVQATFADNIITITAGPAPAAADKPVDAKPAKAENGGK